MEQALHMRRGDDDRAARLIKVPYMVGYQRRGVSGFSRGYKKNSHTSPGATAAIRLILRTGLLDQFKATACETHAESRRSAGEERRGSESRSSGVGVPQ